MLHVGQLNKLKVLRETSIGYYLGDEEGNDVLLPNKYIPNGVKVEDEIEVFIYRDSEDRVIATNLKPFIQLHTFAFLRVRGVNHFGAYLDWGLEKDLFVPFKEQKSKMVEGGTYIVYLFLDTDTDRLVASNKINKFLNNDTMELEKGEEVDLLVYEKTELGYNVIVNNKHKGLVYENEVFQDIAIGDELKGYVKTIREDNKLDISLQKQGFQNLEINAQRIFDYLQEHNGVLPLTDKSDPEEIYECLHMSKGTFKKSVGMLYKQRLIMLQPDGIHLL